MSVRTLTPTAPPLLGSLDRVRAAVEEMAALAPGWSGLEADAVRAACTTIRRLKAALDGQLAAATQALEAAGTARKSGATSTGAMLATDFGGDRRGSEASVRTGQQLATAGADRTTKELLNGRITRQQADIITGGLLRLPDSIDAVQRATCEKELLQQAGRLSLRDLRRAADRATESVEPPEQVDARENSLVEDRERRAWRATEFTLTDQGDGTTLGRFRIPTAQAIMLSTLLDAQAAPRRSHLAEDRHPDDREPLTYVQRRGRALCALIEHVPMDGFASSGGTAATVVVTMDLDTLTERIGRRVGTLPGGSTVSAQQARRLACTHGIIPQVLGGESLPLDLGRSKRLFSRSQRLALAQRDGGCAFPGCDRPPGWCESHHLVPFSAGGSSDLGNGVLLCARHHHLVHDDRWSIRIAPGTGIAEFQPPGRGGWRSNPRYRPRRRPDVDPPDRASELARTVGAIGVRRSPG